MNHHGATPKNKKTSSFKIRNLEEERGDSRVSVRAGSLQGINATIESNRSKSRMNSTKTTIVKREEGQPHSKKRKGKVGVTNVAKKQSFSKRGPLRRNFTQSQQFEGSRIDLQKGDQLPITDLQGPKQKRSRAATCNVESQVRTLSKPKKLTKAKHRSVPQSIQIREQNSYPRPNRENIAQGVYSTIISENEKDKYNLENKDTTSKNSSKFKILSSQHVKWKTKRKSVNNRRSHNIALDTKTRKISLKEKHKNGSHALHSLRHPTLSTKNINKPPETLCIIETSHKKEQKESIQNVSRTLDINTSDPRRTFQSKATDTALKLANDTSGFVRTTLKAVEDSKNINLKIKEGISKRRKEDANMDNKPNELLATVANRYKSTLESLQSSKTLTAEKLIEELGAIGQASKGNVTKIGKLGRRHGGRSTRSTFKKDLKDGPIGRDGCKENSPSDVIIDRKPDVRQVVKLSSKARKNIENQLKKHGIVDEVPQNQGFTPSVATKKSKSVISGFDRLISGASGNKEFENALAQIVSSQDDELGWTKDQQQVLQNAYLNIKQNDGDFKRLASKEVPRRSAKECYDNFYSRHPTPTDEVQAPVATTSSKEVEGPPTMSNSLNKKSKVGSLKATKKQKQLQAQKTIHNILEQVGSVEGSKTKNSTMHKEHVNTIEDVGSVLDRVEDEKAVILQSNSVKDYNNIAPLSLVGEDTHNNDQGKPFAETLVICGVDTPDKENNHPPNGQDAANYKKSVVPRVELILKQVDNGQHLPLPYDSRPKTTSNTSRKKKIIKTNNVYLHSKDALDFGDTTADAIQRAKQELRNVLWRTGSRGGRFVDTESDQIDA